MSHKVVFALLGGGLLSASLTACGGDVQSSTGNGGAGGSGPTCSSHPVSESFEYTLTTFDGIVVSCLEDVDTAFAFDGKVTAVKGAGKWEIDSCSPDANCMPMINTLEVAAPGLSLDLPVGTLVTVTVRVQHFGGICASSLLIRNLPTWGGTMNPTASDGAPWLDGSGGPESPFTVETTLRCNEGAGNDPICSAGQDFYNLSFMVTGDPSTKTVPLESGTGIAWQVPSGKAMGNYAVRNLRAFSGYCEIPGSTEYYIVRTP